VTNGNSDEKENLSNLRETKQRRKKEATYESSDEQKRSVQICGNKRRDERKAQQKNKSRGISVEDTIFPRIKKQNILSNVIRFPLRHSLRS
jgi:hypothetical protein